MPSVIHEIEDGEMQDEFVARYPNSIIFIGSQNCGHCEHIKPFFEDLVIRYPRIAFAHVETTRVKVDGVKGVPTFVAYKSGYPFAVVVGADEDKLNELCRELTL